MFAFDDMTAFGAIKVATEGGLKVPEDISIVGFDDIPMAAYYNPALSTVAQPMQKMGRRGAELLLESKEKGRMAMAGKQVTVEPTLVLRDSTGGPPR